MEAFHTNVAMAIVVGGLATFAWANEASRTKANEAMVVCESVDRMPSNKKPDKLQRLENGLEISEAAVEADEGDARAHLAIVCNLGKQLELSGLSWRVFGRLRRMQAEIDRAHELAPDDPDVLTAKGQILRQTPGPLGGNKEAGLQLLRRAVELQPDHVPARLYLARALADDGAPDARKRLYEVLALAKQRGTIREQTEVQQIIASLDD